MTETLPELPKAALTLPEGKYVGWTSLPTTTDIPWFSADQMRSYATAAVLAERERCAKICDRLADENGASCASAIRATPKGE